MGLREQAAGHSHFRNRMLGHRNGQDHLRSGIDGQGDFQEPFAGLPGPEGGVAAGVGTGEPGGIDGGDGNDCSSLIQGGDHPFLDKRQPERGKSLQELVEGGEVGDVLPVEQLPHRIHHFDQIRESPIILS